MRIFSRRTLVPRLALAFCLASALGLGVTAQAAGDDAPAGLTFDQIFAPDRPGSWPKDLAWSHDGKLLAYRLPDGEEGEALWALEPGSKESRILVRTADLPAAGEGEEAELDAYHFSPAGDGVLLESGGDLLLLDPADGSLTPLLTTEAAEESPAFSPDGRMIAFVRGFDLHVLELATGEERALTSDGEEGVTLNGTPDWVYGEEIWNRSPEGFWWSPDSRRLAYYRFDERPVPTYPLVNFLPQYPEVEAQRYPKAGEPNPRVRIGVVEVGGGETVWLETGDEEAYLARVHWLPGGEKVAVERLNRDQTRLDLLLCRATSGACTTLLSEEWPTWVNLSDAFAFLADGRFIWSSERTGWRHLYLYSAQGELIRALTAGDWAVTSLDGVDEERGRLFFTAYGSGGTGAAHRRVFRLDLGGGEPTPLTSGDGWHGALVAPGGELWVHSVSDAQRPTTRRVLTADSELVVELPTGPEPAFDPATLPAWEYLTIWEADRHRLPARILRPPGFSTEKRYPVIMYHYGCPASQVVADRWEGTRARDLWHRMMAERGYIVLSVDNSTSAFFGKRGEDQAHRSFGPYNLEAQLAAVEYLKSLPYVDPERIGIWGWSGGGSNTLGALLGSPGTWKAGISGAPVTDWHLYDTIWTERYLDRPQDNPEGYRASSPVSFADQLADALLIIHGTGDDNVHPQNTIVMSQAFIEAGVPFEQAIYPRQKHGFRGKAERHLYERMTEFFDRHLAPSP